MVEHEDDRIYINEATSGCRQTGDMVIGTIWQRPFEGRYLYIIECVAMGGANDGATVTVEGDTLGLALDKIVATGQVAMFDAAFFAVCTTVEEWAAATKGPCCE